MEGCQGRGFERKRLGHCQVLYSGRSLSFGFFFFLSKVLFCSQTKPALLSFPTRKHAILFLPISFRVQTRISLEGERRKVGLGVPHLAGRYTENKKKETLLDSRRLSNHFWSAAYLMTSLSQRVLKSAACRTVLS